MSPWTVVVVVVFVCKFAGDETERAHPYELPPGAVALAQAEKLNKLASVRQDCVWRIRREIVSNRVFKHMNSALVVVVAQYYFQVNKYWPQKYVSHALGPVLEIQLVALATGHWAR